MRTFTSYRTGRGPRCPLPDIRDDACVLWDRGGLPAVGRVLQSATFRSSSGARYLPRLDETWGSTPRAMEEPCHGPFAAADVARLDVRAGRITEPRAVPGAHGVASGEALSSGPCGVLSDAPGAAHGVRLEDEHDGTFPPELLPVVPGRLRLPLALATSQHCLERHGDASGSEGRGDGDVSAQPGVAPGLAACPRGLAGSRAPGGQWCGRAVQ